MQEQEIITRIKQLCNTRNWSFYRLAKESGITYSTLCTMLHKANSPSVPTLIKLCNGFGITLSEFFDVTNDTALLSPEEKHVLCLWNALNGENRGAAEKYLRFLSESQSFNSKDP